MRIIAPILSLTLLAAAVALADPYGPPYAVTDMAPFCATCHASTSPAQLLDLPAEAAAAETTEGKHFVRIRTDPAYRDLSPADRERLIAAIKWVDEQASVTIQVPSQARRSSRIEVTVVTRGGAGPVVGVSLVDSAIRTRPGRSARAASRSSVPLWWWARTGNRRRSGPSAGSGDRTWDSTPS